MRRLSNPGFMFIMLLLVLTQQPLSAQTSRDEVCVVPDDGTGTAQMPPPGCSYQNPQESFMIIDGLPAGTTIELQGIHMAFFCAGGPSNDPCLVEPGGLLGGNREVFDSVLIFEMIGTGDLAGYSKTLSIQLAVETHSAPRNPGDASQLFDTEVFLLQGALSGDADFDTLQITAGRGFALPPSFGHTTLSSLGDGTFMVDSFFDITYQIDFVGAPGGALAGLAGSTTATTRMHAYGQKYRCIEPDDGTGTAELPPPSCDYISPRDEFQILDGFPPGTSIELRPRQRDFVCTGASAPGCGQPGGNLGGEVENFSSTLVMQLEGIGALAGYYRALRLPTVVETHTGPRTPGDIVQSFGADIFSLQALLPPGDPDFDQLTIIAGTDNGLPSPGHIVLQQNDDGTFNVDSFFDITYQIDFVGSPGGVLAGLSGSTTATLRMEARKSTAEAIEPAVAGTVEQPPMGSRYMPERKSYLVLDGLPPGTTIELNASHQWFYCTRPGGICGLPGGTLGGDSEEFDTVIAVEAIGTGSLAGFRRNFGIPVSTVTHSGPRTAGDPVQRFDAAVFDMQGTLFADPDFLVLSIRAGADNGLPSPGHTMLTTLGDGTFMVDSFFDVTYEVDFIGAPGGALDGMSGTTNGDTRLTAYEDPDCPSLLTLAARTFSVAETLQSLSVISANGTLTVNADTRLDARRMLALDNGFEADVTASATLTFSTDPTIRCPSFP